MSEHAGTLDTGIDYQMFVTASQAIEEALHERGLDNVWWGMRILEAWPYVVGARNAQSSRPFLEKSDLHGRGLLVVAVRNSTWVQELSFLDIAGRLNLELGEPLVQTVRFDIREVLP